MAGSHRRMLLVDFGRLATSGKRPQNGVETSAFERLLLASPSQALARGRVGRRSLRKQRPGIRRRDRNQSNSGPGRRTAARFGRRSRARRRRPREPGVRPKPARTAHASKLTPGLFELRPRSNPASPACSSLARAPATASPPARTASCPCVPVLPLAARFDDRNHAAVRLDDDRLAEARRLLRKSHILARPAS